MKRLALTAFVALALALSATCYAASHSPIDQATSSCGAFACADTQQSGGATAQQAPAVKDASGVVVVALLISLFVIVPVVWTRQRIRSGASRPLRVVRPVIPTGSSRNKGDRD